MSVFRHSVASNIGALVFGCIIIGGFDFFDCWTGEKISPVQVVASFISEHVPASEARNMTTAGLVFPGKAVNLARRANKRKPFTVAKAWDESMSKGTLPLSKLMPKQRYHTFRSEPMVVLSSFMFLFSVFASWKSHKLAVGSLAVMFLGLKIDTLEPSPFFWICLVVSLIGVYDWDEPVKKRTRRTTGKEN